MTVTVTGLPEPLPNPADPSTFSDRASATLSAINPMMAQMNAQNIENNAINAAVNLSADAAELSATAAMSSANYKGPWLTLAGSLVGYPAFPAFSSVFHNGVFWFSNAAMADVSVNEPSSTSTFWTSIQQQNTGARNLIYNGKMEVAQTGTSFPAASGYTLDGFIFESQPSGGATVGRSTLVPSGKGFYNSMVITCTTANPTVSSGNYAIAYQLIEGVNTRRLVGVDFVLSFWIRSSKTGVYCVAFRSSNSDRSYVAEYTVNSVDTWEKKTVRVSGGIPSGGAWSFGEGERGLGVAFSFACGSTFQTTKNTWNTGNFVATSNQVNLFDTLSNFCCITGVQLEAGKYATEFEHRSYSDELRICRRYYEKVSTYFIGYQLASQSTRWTVSLQAPKCKTPTSSAYVFAAINCTPDSSAVMLGEYYGSFSFGCLKNGVTGQFESGVTITLDARL